MEEKELEALMGKVAEKANTTSKALIEEFKGSLSKERKEEIENAVKAVVGDFGDKETMSLAELMEVQLKQGQDLSKLINGEGIVKSQEEQVKEFVVKNHDKIKELHKSGNGSIEVEIKAVATITTASGTNTSPPALTGTQQAPLQNVNLREMDITSLTNNQNTSVAAFAYTEAEPKDGLGAFTAEGIAKTQVDFDWNTRYATPVKAAAWLKLTEESIDDVANLQSVATDYLFRRHNLVKNKGILNGDGNAPNPKGATEYATTFTAGDLAGTVEAPNFMDVVNACITKIATTHNFTDEIPYMPNIVMINPVDFFAELVAAKDENGLPLYPFASLFNRVTIGGVTIIPEESITAGQIFVGDMTKYNTTNYKPYTVRIGWVNDDFIKNQFVIIGESRFHAFVKNLDEVAFIYDSIEDIKTAITAT